MSSSDRQITQLKMAERKKEDRVRTDTSLLQNLVPQDFLASAIILLHYIFALFILAKFSSLTFS